MVLLRAHQLSGVVSLTVGQVTTSEGVVYLRLCSVQPVLPEPFLGSRPPLTHTPQGGCLSSGHPGQVL
jgi:hypothetical protein